MKFIEAEKLYLIEGIVGTLTTIISIPAAMDHFIRGSITFSMMMPFMVLSAVIAFFTLSVHFEGTYGRYKKSAILNAKGLGIILSVNMLALLLLAI